MVLPPPFDFNMVEHYQKPSFQMLQNDFFPNLFTSTMVEEKFSKINFLDSPEWLFSQSL